MNMSKESLKACIKKYVMEPQGKARIICWLLAGLFGLFGLLLVLSAFLSGAVLPFVLSIPAFFVLVALPFAFFHFFKRMIDALGSREAYAAELAAQTEGYNALPFRETYRGMAFYMTAFILIITALVGFFASNLDMIFETAFIIPLMYWMRKGSRWVFLLGMIWWTLEKLIQLQDIFPRAASVSVIIWLVLVDYIYYQAFLVERGAAALAKENPEYRKRTVRDILVGLAVFVVMLVGLTLLTQSMGF